MEKNIQISICIPAYNRTDLLKRLLDSICIQDFKDYEVIVTDDSPNDSVKELCQRYSKILPIKYFKNTIPLGTPENWNEAIRKASGNWIKIMHHDDWFSGPDSLSAFSHITQNDNHHSFVFCAFNNVNSSGESETIRIDSWRFRLIKRSPVNLLSKNIIGPPSNTFFKNQNHPTFDKNLKWLVDIEFYIRFMRTSIPVYMNEPLVNIGIHDEQVTVTASLNPEVEIFEHLYLTKTIGPDCFNQIMFFDAWWRLLRNLKVRELSYLVTFSGGLAIPSQVRKMIAMQRRIPLRLLNLGVVSKFLMTICYVFCRK